MNVRVRGHDFANARRARLSHAGGMGIAYCDLALLAASRRDQFPWLVRSRATDAARNGRSAHQLPVRLGPPIRLGFGTCLHQRWQWRARCGGARCSRFAPATRVPHLVRNPDERAVVPRSRPDFSDARYRSETGGGRLGLQRVGRQISAVRSR